MDTLTIFKRKRQSLGWRSLTYSQPPWSPPIPNNVSHVVGSFIKLGFGSFWVWHAPLVAIILTYSYCLIGAILHIYINLPGPEKIFTLHRGVNWLICFSFHELIIQQIFVGDVCSEKYVWLLLEREEWTKQSACSHGISSLAAKMAILEEMTSTTGFKNPNVGLASPHFKPSGWWITKFPE